MNFKVVRSEDNGENNDANGENNDDNGENKDANGENNDENGENIDVVESHAEAQRSQRGMEGKE